MNITEIKLKQNQRTVSSTLQAVVKVNSQSNGKGQILTPGAPKPLNGFRQNLKHITTS